MSSIPSESAIRRRAESRGLRIEKHIDHGQDDRFTLIDQASGVVVRKELDVDELVHVLQWY